MKEENEVSKKYKVPGIALFVTGLVMAVAGVVVSQMASADAGGFESADIGTILIICGVVFIVAAIAFLVYVISQSM